MSNWDIRLFVPDITEAEEEAVLKPLRSKWLTMGHITEEFQQKFAELLDVKYAYAVSGGSPALHLALMALNVKPGDEVLVPSLTFVACANVIVACGAKPVFVDITSENDWTISPEDIKKKITSKTKGIMVVHFAGFPCDMDKICALAKEENIFVIEDCAHALVSDYKSQKCGTIGDVGCFSFYSNKNMTTSEGGMVVTNNQELAERLKIMRSHGMTAMPNDRFQGKSYSYDIQAFGLNYRIDDLRSSIGLVQLNRLHTNLKRRIEAYDTYIQELDTCNVDIPFRKRNSEEKIGYHIFPILAKTEKKRLDIIDALKVNRIQTSYHYQPIHTFSIYQEYFESAAVNCPITENVASREITLPFYPGLTQDKIKTISSKIDMVLSTDSS